MENGIVVELLPYDEAAGTKGDIPAGSTPPVQCLSGRKIMHNDDVDFIGLQSVLASRRLQEIVSLTNAISLEENASCRDTCILTSYALNNVLRRLGYNSYPLRVEAEVFPDDKSQVGTILGGLPNGCRREAAAPGMWHGHLVVAIAKSWLLDATLDQANKYTEWPSTAWVGPVVIQLGDPFWKEQKRAIIQVNETSVSYRLYPRQNGFACAGDARRSHWEPLSDKTHNRVVIFLHL